MHNTMPELHKIAVIIIVLASPVWISLQENGAFPSSFNSTWYDATQNCVLYGSDVFNDTVIFPSKENVSSVYWIGATVNYTPVFTLLGCYVLQIDPEEVQGLSDKDSEGPMLQCYKKCKKINKSFIDFGINRTHCGCSRNMKERRETKKSCSLDQFSDTSNDVYANELKSFAVFQKAVRYSYGTVEVKSTEECIAVKLINNNTDSKHISIPCQERLPYICEETLCTEKVTWFGAARKCNTTLKANTLGRYAQNVNGTVMAWTGFFRRLILKWTNESENETACAAVMYKPGIGAYRIGRPCTELFPSLCQHTVRSTVILKNEPATESTPNAVVDDHLKTIMFIGIGVGASVVIMSAIIVFAVIYQRKIKTKKRKEIAEKKTLNSTSDQTTRPSVVLNNAKENSDYDSTMNTRRKCSNGDTQSQHYGKLHSEDICYDHTNTFQKLQVSDSEYSTVQSGDNVYDHTRDVQNLQIDDGDYSAVSTNADRGMYDNPSKMDNRNPNDSNYGVTGLVGDQSL